MQTHLKLKPIPDEGHGLSYCAVVRCNQEASVLYGTVPLCEKHWLEHCDKTENKLPDMVPGKETAGC